MSLFSINRPKRLPWGRTSYEVVTVYLIFFSFVCKRDGVIDCQLQSNYDFTRCSDKFYCTHIVHSGSIVRLYVNGLAMETSNSPVNPVDWSKLSFKKGKISDGRSMIQNTPTVVHFHTFLLGTIPLACIWFIFI